MGLGECRSDGFWQVERHKLKEGEENGKLAQG
jgi:hypothetical protein